MVAIKVLAPEREHDARFAERFAREAELLAKLSHPHIVTIHDFGQTEGLFYIVMEFVDGVNLRDLLREGKIEPRQALAIVPPVCEALQYAHDHGVVHRTLASRRWSEATARSSGREHRPTWRRSKAGQGLRPITAPISTRWAWCSTRC
jgi:aminoglycoside phosphotransferase (APT) family kinase protein